MLLLGFHLVHFVKPVGLKIKDTINGLQPWGKITRINENKNNLSFKLISHIGEIGKIHLTSSETLHSAVIMTD